MKESTMSQKDEFEVRVLDTKELALVVGGYGNCPSCTASTKSACHIDGLTDDENGRPCSGSGCL
jgi:hypothetical protein